jgi:Fic family protein
MDTSHFGNGFPGELTPIDARWGRDYAFLPAPLPPTWEFPADMWPLLMEATNKLNMLEGFGRQIMDPSVLLRPMRDREAIRSSEIEGTYANPKELLLFELDPKESHSQDDRINDSREVLNYRNAMHYAEQTELPLCLRLLKDLHRILMQGVRGEDKTPGEFRKIPVAMGQSGKFIPPPHHRLMEFLDPFESYLHIKEPKYHKLVDCFLAHYQFETIHPFSDGNGRVGRLLLSIMLRQSCDLSQPWLYMSEYFEKNREGYYEGLYRVSTEGAWSNWIRYCLEGVSIQADVTIRRFKAMMDAKQAFHDRVVAMGASARLVAIIDTLFHRPLIRVTAVRDQFSVNYNTAKADVEKLVGLRILTELPDQYPKTYYAPEIFTIAYEGLE